MKFGLTIAKDSIDFGILEIDMVSTIATGVETVESNQMMGEYALGGGTGEFEKPSVVYSVIVESAGVSAANGTYEQDGESDGVAAFSKGLYRIYRNLSSWTIFVLDGETQVELYFNAGSSDLPPESSWVTGEIAYEPAPTLTIVAN